MEKMGICAAHRRRLVFSFQGSSLPTALLLLVLLVAVTVVEEVRGDELWERWGDRAQETCGKLIHGRKGRGKLEIICDNFQEVVENELRLLAINSGAALGKQDARENIEFTNELADRAEEEPYRSDGEKIIQRTAQHFIDNNIASPKEMKKHFFTKSAQWLMNVAVNNRRSLEDMPAYPDIDDLERRMHKDDL